SGRTHVVYTGAAVVLTDEAGAIVDRQTLVEATDVTFFDLSDEEIRAYIATGEPMDKAGAYGIQGLGCTLVEGIRGDYLTVVGLPAARVVRLLNSVGVEPSADHHM
ncbi:MAG: Maf family protein, partial [Clostridia bacterium]|nr:Maf family protein [Clostridia bacterium]